MDGSVGKGRPRKCWLKCVKDEMTKLGLESEIAQNRIVWRLAIHVRLH